MAGNDRTRPFSSREKDVKLMVVARIGCTPYTASAYGQTWVRTLTYAYAVVNSTTRNWAHLTSKHPQSPQKMGEGDYGRIPKGFVLFFDFGEEGRPYWPVLANIFLGFCKEQIPDDTRPRMYRRFVDDTFSVTCSWFSQTHARSPCTHARSPCTHARSPCMHALVFKIVPLNHFTVPWSAMKYVDPGQLFVRLSMHHMTTYA